VEVYDLTGLKRADLDIDWGAEDVEVDKKVKAKLKEDLRIRLDNSRGEIKEILPKLWRGEREIRQPRFDYSHAKAEKDYDKIVSGFPLKDEERHFVLKRKCGETIGDFIGFMDDLTPVRLKQEPCKRLSTEPDRVWFRLDTDFKGTNKSKCFNGPQDNRSYCAYDIVSAQSTFTWFSITKVINGAYPVWANQFDIWAPDIPKELTGYWHSLCFAFVLAENRCVVTKFEADNPVPGAPEVYVDNPLCPSNHESFWCTTLDKEVVSEPETAKNLVDAVKDLYRYWNHHYTKGQVLQHVGLENEPYFKYFNYPDFLTPHSGLIQIRKYAEINQATDLIERFEEISRNVKLVKAELYRVLVEESGYFK
jgi:hypothetical protein